MVIFITVWLLFRRYSFADCAHSDYGYQRADGITGPCVRDPSVTLPNPCASGNVTTYYRSRG